MSDLSISCIIPAYNAERFLGEALESVFRQTRPLDEVIVVDDGSEDGTREVLSHFGDRVHIVEGEHEGLTRARDRGLAAARGELLCFLDADDVWLPQKTERQIQVLDREPQTDLCVTHFQNFWDEEIAQEAEHYRDHPLTRPMTGYVVPTLLARRRVFDRFGGFSDGPTFTDTGWFARVIRGGASLSVLSDVLMLRRFHRTNDSRGGNLDSVFELIKIRLAQRRVAEGEG